MRCVKCSGELETRAIGPVDVDQCASCRGVWFDRRELEVILRGGGVSLLDAGEPRSGGQDERRGACPRCHKPLERVESLTLEGLHFDQCASCEGVWLDQVEVHRLATDPAVAAVGQFFTDFI